MRRRPCPCPYHPPSIHRAHGRGSPPAAIGRLEPTTISARSDRPICEDAYMSGSPAGTLQLRPIRGVRYAAHTDLARVIAPPYDVIDEVQQRELEASDPHNIVRVILPRERVDQSTDRYTGAAHLFEQWLADGVVSVDDTPALYVYQ